VKTMITCPNCNSTFASKGHLKDAVSGFSSLVDHFSQRRSRPLLSDKNNKNIIDSSNIVVCPKCGLEFADEEYRLFGILSLSVFKGLLIAFIVILFLAFPMYILIRDLMK
jgi:hypothetical protein